MFAVFAVDPNPEGHGQAIMETKRICKVADMSREWHVLKSDSKSFK
jgi:hypothetical protein